MILEPLLIIIPYNNIYPPMNGGMQRCFNILSQLVKHFDVTAIIHQDKASFMECVNEFPEMKKAGIYSTKDVITKDLFNLLPSKFEKALRYRWYTKQIRATADGNFLKYYPILKELLSRKKFQLVVLENMSTLNAVKMIRTYQQEAKIIYDAHNVDSNLAKAALQKGEITKKRLDSIFKTEINLHKTVDAVFACSERDANELIEMNHGNLAVEVVPNGVAIPARRYNQAVETEAVPEYIMFCGSLWFIPNAEGLAWFCDEIWPSVLKVFPDLKLLVLGSGELPEKYNHIKQTVSISFTGTVDDVKIWYNKAGISIVPLLTGSGTRLKILEAMGLGVPVVSTSLGAEGINYTDGKDILIADSAEAFASKLIQLLKSKNDRMNLQLQAIALVKAKYDWDLIGEKMSDYLNKKILANAH